MTPDEADDLLYSLGAALEAGVLALNALSRGEAADPAALDALADVLEEQRVTITETSRAAAGNVRALRALLPAEGAPSPEAQALAEECRIAIATPPPAPARAI